MLPFSGDSIFQEGRDSVRYLALAVSTLAFLAWFYSVYLFGFTPGSMAETVPVQIQGMLLLLPALIWWGVSLLTLGKQRKWAWLVCCLILMPLGLLVYDMYRARASTN